MKPNQIFDEARKYLFYVSDALNGASQSHSLGKKEREIVAKYAADMLEYAKGLEQLKNYVVSQELDQKRIQIKADLEERHQAHKKVLNRAEQNLRVVKNRLTEIKKSGSDKEIEEAKARVDYYTKQHLIAKQNESTAQNDFERGA